MNSYNHNQAISSTTWIITHNLGGSVTASDVIMNVSGVMEKVLPGSVVHTSDNTLTLTFSSPATGKARVLSL